MSYTDDLLAQYFSSGAGGRDNMSAGAMSSNVRFNPPGIIPSNPYANTAPGFRYKLKRGQEAPKAADPWLMYTNPLNPDSWYDYWEDENGNRHYGKAPGAAGRIVPGYGRV